LSKLKAHKNNCKETCGKKEKEKSTSTDRD
jgi:hypothetical protein